MQVWLIGNLKLSVGVNVDICLSLSVGPAINWCTLPPPSYCHMVNHNLKCEVITDTRSTDEIIRSLGICA